MTGARVENNEAELLIRHGVVLPMSEGEPVIEDGAVAISAGKILAVGPDAELARLYHSRQEIDAARMAVLPGFVNTHFHFMQNFLKGSRDDLDLLGWIDQVSFPRIRVVVDQYHKGNHLLHHHSAMHAGIDLLKSGVTCTVNMEWAMGPSVVDAYDLIKMRVINTLTLTDVTSWTPPEAVLSNEEYFSLADALIDRCKRSKRTEFAYGVACPNSNTEAMLRRAREEATKNHVRLHVHLAETEYEYNSIKEKHGVTPTKYLEQLGFWGKDTWGAHCIWLDDEDVDILKRYGVGVAHNPKCNMKIADGAAPIRQMLQKGVDVGLGIDSCAVSDNTDFFEAMRTAAFLQRLVTKDATALRGRDVLRMATIGGARAVKMDSVIGSLEPGKSADLILVDLTGTNMRPYNDYINNIVFAANSNNIRLVMVEGEVLVHGGRMISLDEDAALDAAEEYAYKTFTKAGLSLAPYFQIAKRN
ncbi:MAG: amidohydrolase [Bacillota bacterium]